MNPFGIDDIHRSAARLNGKVITTPLLSSPQLDTLTHCKLLVKAENLQLTGSFKIRGALNKVLTLTAQQRQHGVVTFSAGNHGQGVAAAAKQAGCPAVIVLPANAPQIKIDNCRWWGAEVVTYNPGTEDRETVSQRFVDEHNMTLIHPFDDPDIMGGQGTVGLELCAQAAEQGHSIDALVISCSGGGLASGVVTAVAHAFPDVEIYLVEPVGGEKMRRSLESRQAQRNAPGQQTIMDAINGPVVGVTPLLTLSQYPVSCLSVTDSAALQAMNVAFRLLKIVAEPGGIASLAAVLQHASIFQDKTVAVICSGGNVDPDVFMRTLQIRTPEDCRQVFAEKD